MDVFRVDYTWEVTTQLPDDGLIPVLLMVSIGKQTRN